MPAYGVGLWRALSLLLEAILLLEANEAHAACDMRLC